MLLEWGYNPEDMAPRKVSLQTVKTVTKRAAGLRPAKFKMEKSVEDFPAGITPLELAVHLGRGRIETIMRKVCLGGSFKGSGSL